MKPVGETDLIGERGVEQDAINFMAYWAKGRVR